MKTETALREARGELGELAIRGPFLDLIDQMLGEVDVVKVLRETSHVVEQLFDAERVTIYRVLGDTQELEAAAVIGNVSRTIRVPIREDSLAGFCASRCRAFTIQDAYGDLSEVDPCLRFDQSWDEVNQFRTRDVMCVPAAFKGQVLGVVQVINSRNEPFDDGDLRPLENVSRFVSYALYHAGLYDELATLKCLEKEKAEFMRIVVHELRSPVSASKSLVSALQFINPENAQLHKTLGRVEERMDQLLELVEDILHLSRVKAGKPLGEISVCDLRDETQTVYDQYIDPAKAKGLALSLALPDSAVRVRVDRQGFNLILSNLISNSVKYTGEGAVGVTLDKREPWAVLAVSDTGMGIPTNDIPKLFGEFFRASNARRSKIKGTGVGLAGVKELVERFGGEIEMTSEEGTGSTFTVRLPLSAS